MIVICKKGTTQEQIDQFTHWLHDQGMEVHLSRGTRTTLLGLVGDTSSLDAEQLASLPFVERVQRISEPYKKANRKFHPEDTVVDVSGRKLGGGHFCMIAGPCSVESAEQITEVAQAVKVAGACVLRGGAFKPRTSPYAFQGLGPVGLDLLRVARQKTGMPIVSEVMDREQLPHFADVDIIQVGARNMQNFTLLRAVGEMGKPVLLKRGLSSTIEEFLMSAEYVMAGGCEQVILCERGIRTFETATRNTLDLSAIPLLKRLSHLPVVVDPSHATGIPWMIEPMSRAAVAAGADGLIIEVHNAPEKALCDGAQSLRPQEFADLVKGLQPFVKLCGKEWAR
ncbi:3-deoxy-7-phosphoheptulonate synthase [Bittarella massiliensis]|uniref:3-deoxy-7-phosphoheptulonate synthase n=1 Tax=Bittarella massiliensis (ex Durand et al. 2017) TaxID=1720313 RepID=UPI00163C0F4E|nr:3-deoxy-7-phosphoheptulonate synthase [Bittarella massiliensis (ex Durand et al. 2017)]MBC2871009.1 3-deoxy-7-phosphoheptulonate synthase [Bittarella massiliensis (ex Durand et al. 2017)]